MGYYKIHVDKDGTITNTGGGEIPPDVMGKIQSIVQAPLLPGYTGAPGSHYKGDYIVRPNGKGFTMAKVGQSWGYSPEFEPWRVVGGPTEVPENWRELLEKQQAAPAIPLKEETQTTKALGDKDWRPGTSATYHIVPKPELINGKLPLGYREFKGPGRTLIYGYRDPNAPLEPSVPTGGYRAPSLPIYRNFPYEAALGYEYAHPEYVRPIPSIYGGVPVSPEIATVSPSLSNIQAFREQLLSSFPAGGTVPVPYQKIGATTMPVVTTKLVTTIPHRTILYSDVPIIKEIR